jgi:hypothetical protein
MQHMLDHWEGGLRATGGALVTEKSYWYTIDFFCQDPQRHWMSSSGCAGKLVHRTRAPWLTLPTRVQKTSSLHYKNLAPHNMAVLQRV